MRLLHRRACRHDLDPRRLADPVNVRCCADAAPVIIASVSAAIIVVLVIAANRLLARRIEYTHPHFGMVPQPCRRDRLTELI